ncbi:DUF362 domain-containing protein [bacterium]|nr:DUF362 domain-containing protein [candidate division CSSED10-310 bacterium]
MASKVFFLSSRAKIHSSPAERFRKLIESIGLSSFKADASVALKIHFGEEGATGYIHPTYVRTLVTMLKERQCLPFLTDTNTLYRGPRSNGVKHYELAVHNGFGYAAVNAPIVIADGIKSRSVTELPAGPHHFKSVKIGSAIAEADALISLNHFKGHLVTSFGGAIKNLSMGCGSRATKQRMHADMQPILTGDDKCVGCGQCVLICPVNAIKVTEGTARFDLDRCIGCAECLSCCPEGAIRIQWAGTSVSVQQKMAEVALAVTKHFKTKILHVNFLLNITPECDCLKWTDNPIVQDIGILASRDPVALDQASLDLVRDAPGLPDSQLANPDCAGIDKFPLIHENVDPDAQLAYGETIGLGSRDYERITVG